MACYFQEPKWNLPVIYWISALPDSVELYSRESRKAHGIFYTPDFLADYVAKKVIHYLTPRPSKILAFDPACGDGILLRSFAKQLINEKLVRPSTQFVGIDLDANAIRNSRTEFKKYPVGKAHSAFIRSDSLFPIDGQDSAEGWSGLRQLMNCEKGFNVGLSNPPWGAELANYSDRTLANNFALAKGQFDIFDLFVEIIISNLTTDGLYGLIIPDSIFSHEQTHLRALLAKETTIYLVARLGEKIFSEINRSCVVIVGRKQIPQARHLIDCFRLSPSFKKEVLSSETCLDEVERKLSHKVPQSRFMANDKYIFDIDLTVEEEGTFYKIRRVVNLPRLVPIKNTHFRFDI